VAFSQAQKRSRGVFLLLGQAIIAEAQRAQRKDGMEKMSVLLRALSAVQRIAPPVWLIP